MKKTKNRQEIKTTALHNYLGILKADSKILNKKLKETREQISRDFEKRASRMKLNNNLYK